MDFDVFFFVIGVGAGVISLIALPLWVGTLIEERGGGFGQSTLGACVTCVLYMALIASIVSHHAG